MNKKNISKNQTLSKIRLNATEMSGFIKTMDYETKFKFWIKTLLFSYKTFPEIIKTVDKIIELQASTISFTSDVYNKNKTTMNQLEKVIDLSQRKNSLVNIYIMTKELLKKLSSNDTEFIEKRFMYNWSTEELAKEYNISERTVYRKTDRIIDKIYKNSIINNWTLKFIESQVKEEGWLKEKFLKCVSDYFKICNHTNIQKELEIAS